MYILGISSFYHDSAACLISNGKVVSAVEEERFTRVKHDNTFPYNSISFCLGENELNIKDVDYVAYYEKPLLKFERILETFINTWPRSYNTFQYSIPEWLGEKLKIESIIRDKIGFKKQIFFIPHHLSHASSAFLTSPFKSSAILTIDGVGDLPTTGFWLGDTKMIKSIGEINFPHSLGLFYSTWTSFLGFRVNNDEYKVMGLAAYGKPIYEKKITEMINLQKDGSFELNLDYFSFRESVKRMWSPKFEKRFGKSRQPGDAIKQKHKDLAASMQKVTERVYFSLLKSLYRKTGNSNLCVSGGVGLNSLANGKIFRNTEFKNIHIFGPAGDSGASLGAALFVYKYLKKGKISEIKNLYLGPSFSREEIAKILKDRNLRFKEMPSDKVLIRSAAEMLSKNKIVGWFRGKMEFGPRALGARSILANPKMRNMKDKVNKIKKRENFRPFAGSVLQEHVSELFEVPEKNHYSPFMNFCFMVKKEAEKNIAAIVHEDGTCRIQTVNHDNSDYYRLIKEFYKLSGIPCILNTSFNLSHEPIVENPQQAISDFLNSSMDVLVLENFIVTK